MVARITTAAFQGIDVQPVDVQVHMAQGLPAFTMMGPNNENTNSHYSMALARKCQSRTPIDWGVGF